MAGCAPPITTTSHVTSHTTMITSHSPCLRQIPPQPPLFITSAICIARPPTTSVRCQSRRNDRLASAALRQANPQRQTPNTSQGLVPGCRARLAGRHDRRLVTRALDHSTDSYSSDARVSSPPLKGSGSWEGASASCLRDRILPAGPAETCGRRSSHVDLVSPPTPRPELMDVQVGP